MHPTPRGNFFTRVRAAAWRSRLFPRKLSFTREGKVLVVVAIGLGLAAVNTGNNLIYLVFGLTLSIILISGVLSESNLRRLAIREISATRATAGAPLAALISIRCGRRRFPAMSIDAWPLFDRPDCDVQPARFLELKPGESAEGTCLVTFPRRGEYRLIGMVLSTTFPFSFFRKSAVLEAARVVLVHPAATDVAIHELRFASRGEEIPRDIAGREGEFFGTREFREGDDPRLILHRLSAGRPWPVLRELEGTGGRLVHVVLVNARPGVADGAVRVEKAIERTAGLVSRLLEAGDQVGLVTLSGEVEAGSGPAQRERILDFLALIPVVEMNSPGVEDFAAARVPAEGAVVWVRPG